eukprot:1167150-Alexandrium_andersonii.AAC.1
MRTPRDARIAWREQLVCKIEQRVAAFRASGAMEAWFTGADPIARTVAGAFNGPLAEWLLTQGSAP